MAADEGPASESRYASRRSSDTICAWDELVAVATRTIAKVTRSGLRMIHMARSLRPPGHPDVSLVVAAAGGGSLDCPPNLAPASGSEEGTEPVTRTLHAGRSERGRPLVSMLATLTKFVRHRPNASAPGS